jgi:DNA-binding PadR family transcriptional regulator
LAVLACLYEAPMHPYEVAQTLRSRAKHESVRLNYGSLYSVVDSLESRGLIHPLETTREGRRPERTVYEITDTGARELVDWLSDLLATPVKEYPQFVTALSFLPVLPPEDALELLTTRADALEIWIAQQRGGLETAERGGLPRLFELEAEFQLHIMQAELEWVRALIKDIATDSLDGIAMWRRFIVDDSPPTFEWRSPNSLPE